MFAYVFAKVFCGPRVECQTQDLEWSRDWSCAKLVGRTMGLCKMYVTGPPVQGGTYKYGDRRQPPTVIENEYSNDIGGCPGELDEMGLEVAL